jgi:diguanylate cyclase (GGDEF)-like protein/PAS domain S-box-containing protein
LHLIKPADIDNNVTIVIISLFLGWPDLATAPVGNALIASITWPGYAALPGLTRRKPMRYFFTTLRFRLLLLVFLAVLPALAVILYSGLEQRRMAAEAAKQNVLDLVHHASLYQERVVEGVRQMLLSLAELPAVRQQDGAVASAVFSRILEKQKIYGNISAADRHGKVFATARPQPGQAPSAAGRSHFEQALNTRDFAIGEFGIGRTSGKPTIHFGYPLIDYGVVQGVVSASVVLDCLNTLIARSQLPPGSMITVIDRDGAILSRHPQPEQWVGKRMPEAEIVKIVLAKGEGIAEAVGIDGVPCLFAFTPLEVGSHDLFVYAGVPLKTVYAGANRVLTRNLLALGVAALLALIAAWLLGQFFLIGRTQTLVNTSQQLAGGDLAVRSGLAYDDGEFGQLAQSFDEMAAALQHRQESLRESEEKYRTLVEQLPAIIYAIAPDEAGTLLYVSPPAEGLLGVSPAEYLADPAIWKSQVHPEDRDRVLAEIEASFATLTPIVDEIRLQSRSGALLWFHTEARPVPDPSGRPLYLQGVMLDITDRKRVEEDLAASEVRYRTLVENIDLGITLISSDYKIIMTNAGLGKIFGRPPQEFVGKYCFREFEKRDGICPHCPAVKAMASGQPMEVDTIGVHNDGTFHYAHVRTFPTFDSLGNVTGFVEVVEDTTARRQVEDQLAWEGKVNSSVAELSRALLASRSIEDISQMVLDNAVALTNSSLGYCGYLDPQTGYFIVPTLTREVWEVCEVPDKNIIFKEFTGLWGYGLEHRQSVLSNNPGADPRSSGTPQGHIPIHNFISVPAMLGEQLLGQLGIANAPGDYSAKDQEVCERLALVYALSIQRQRAEEALRQSEARFRDITENVAEWVWEVDLEGKFTYSSPVVEQLLGYKPEEVLGKHFYDFFLPNERQALKEQAFAIFFTKQPFRDFISPNLHKNGKIVWLSASGVPVLDAQGNSWGCRGANIDITERRKSQEALEIANTRLKALLEEADERNRNMALLNDMVDVLQSCRTSAEAFEAIGHFVPKFFPTDAGALYLLRNSKNLLSPVTVWGQPPPSEELFPPDDCWAIRGGRVHRMDDPASPLLCKHVTLSGTLATGYLCVPLMAQGVSLGIFHIRFLSCAKEGREAGELEDKQRLAMTIAENLALALANLKLREILQNQAIRDPLTGLYNRRYLEETMDRELHRSRRLKAPLGVVMMDLDHFKDFNDSLGHGAGDALLSALAHVITAGIRTEDIACRYGGEEFLLVMPGASLETTRERAEHVRQAVKALQVKYQGRLLKSATISLGVAIFPDHGVTADEVIAAADTALYRAKQSGRDRVEVANLNSPAAAAP